MGAAVRVLARNTSIEELPSGIAKFAVQCPEGITVGREYDVYAVSVFEGVVFHQVVDDFRWPVWLPAWHFDVVDHGIPDDWTFNTFRAGRLACVIGPDFVSSSKSAHEQMVELEPEQVEQFWSRVEALSGGSQQNDSDVGGGAK